MDKRYLIVVCNNTFFGKKVQRKNEVLALYRVGKKNLIFIEKSALIGIIPPTGGGPIPGLRSSATI